MVVVDCRKYSCKYPGCNNGYFQNPSRPNKHFFTIPKDPKLEYLWKKACNVPESKFWNPVSVHICEDHFELRDFVNEFRNRLNPGVVPIPVLPKEFAEISQERDEACNNNDINRDEFIKPCLPTSEELNNDNNINEDCSEIETLDSSKIKNVQFEKPYFKRSPIPHLPIYEESVKDEKMNEDCSQRATIDSTEIKNVKLEKPYFKGLKSFSLVSNSVHDVCRICLRLLKSEQIKKLDDQISVEGVDHVKDILQIILPSLDMEIYSETVVCTKCTELLICSYELRKIWMLTEENFLKIVENKKEVTKPESDLIIVTESKVGEVINEYSTEDIKTNIKFDHDYVEILEAPQSKRGQNRALVENVLQEFPELPDSSGNISIIEPSFNKNVQIFHNGIKLRTDMAPSLNFPRRNKFLWGSGPYICEKCGFFSSHLPQFRLHLYKHNRPQRYKLIRKKNLKTFRCGRCSRMFETAEELEGHLSKHQSYQCNICDKKFIKYSSLKQHIRYVHLKDYNYHQCHICGKQCIYKTSLHLHLLRHNTPNKTYKCDHCPKKFRLALELRNHFKRVHKNENPENCQYCGKTLKFEASLRKHIRLYHLNQGEGICEICNKPYWKKPDLIRHKMRIHGIYPQEESKR